MFKLYSTFNRLTIQYGCCMWTSLQLQSFRNTRNVASENFHSKRYLQISTIVFDKSTFSKSERSGKDTKQGSDKEKDEIQVPKILLIEKGRKVGIVTLDEARHIAKKRNRQISKVEQPGKRSAQDVYQLLTRTELQEEETKSATKEEEKPKGSKGEKTLTIGSNISNHDLEIKSNSVKKWITQKYTIRITINNDEANSADRIFDILQKAATESGGKSSQKKKSSDGKMLRAVFQNDS